MSHEQLSFGRNSPRRRPGSAATSDSSLSEIRFGSLTPLPLQSSLSSQAATTWDDSDLQRPSSRRDRRKGFDATTPTLIDEEDYDQGDDAGYICKQLQLHQQQEGNDDNSHRRTPGASMYRSSIHDRMSPGEAMLMEQSSQDSDTTGLGFGLTLASPVAATANQSANSWESISATATPQQSFASMHGDAKTSASASRNYSPYGRHGAFSPALLRLTEDIGNLLNEEEDDAYTVEMPLFRNDASYIGAIDLEATPHNQWGGQPVAVDSNASLAKRITADGHIMAAEKPRRKVLNLNALPISDGLSIDEQQEQLQPRLQQFRNTQQPIARRGNNDVFEFGTSRAPATTQQSTSLHHFGGAFAPPAKEAAISFARPFQLHTPVLAETTTSTPETQQSTLVSSQMFYQEHQIRSIDAFAADQTLQSSQSFDTFSTATQRDTPIEVYFQRSNRLSSPSPSPSPSHPYPLRSDMVATAQEYIPRSSKQSSTPQFPQQMWAHPSPMPSLSASGPYDASMTYQNTWHASSPGLGSVYSSSFGDSRSVMTPSPHLPSMYMEMLPPADAPYTAPVATHQLRDRLPVYTGASSPLVTSGKDGSKRENPRGRIKWQSRKNGATSGQTTSNQIQKTVRNKISNSQGMTNSMVARVKVEDIEAGALASEGPADSRRAELDESPEVRLAFKNFYKAYRAEEQNGVMQAEQFATNALRNDNLPATIHWRIYVELADLARRTNRFTVARRHYQRVCTLQPYASQGWVEYSKLEEECGNMNRVANIMYAGLEYCEYNENLMIRAIKHQEKMGQHGNVRALLARLKHVATEKVWRTVLEGALFEARVGNISIARRALKYVMNYVPWYGPLYVEFYRLERDHGHTLDALKVVELGLSQVPRYNPLWFSALRVCEELDVADGNYDLTRTKSMLQRANTHVSKEVIWKVFLEAAFAVERAAMEISERRRLPLNSLLIGARSYFALTIRSCRLNLRWKVWLAGARMELSAGKVSAATRLFARAHEVAPEKVRSLTLLDYARLHEYIGKRDIARAILCKGRVDYGHDWKLWLESVLLEMRGCCIGRAFELATDALEVHGGTGRLWSALVQLSYQIGGVDGQYNALRKALNAVPKSGEVWCEGARIHCNPFSATFDISRSRRHLFFAGRFTPQYGDSFLESIRVKLVRQWLFPIAHFIWDKTQSSFIPSNGQGDEECLIKYITDISLAVSLACQQKMQSARLIPNLVHAAIIQPVRERLSVVKLLRSFDLADIYLSCSNADPNYGPLWFYCRRLQNDPPQRVLEHASAAMLAEIRTVAHIYIAAQVRRHAILSTNDDADGLATEESLELFDPAAMELEKRTDTLLRSYPSLQEIYNPPDPMTGSPLLECNINTADFATGLMEFSRNPPLEQMSLLARRKALFATDALFP
ncbi:hypothetical protein MPSEU_000656400 [Mayamaea pseudoterrestris]|nr:hypothetical protein MPSEU_000656400 [Mayamaea pseudoterrestris]